MSKAQHVITAVVLEGPSKSEVARDYDVSRYWAQQLCRRYEAKKGFDAGADTIATTWRSIPAWRKSLWCPRSGAS